MATGIALRLAASCSLLCGVGAFVPSGGAVTSLLSSRRAGETGGRGLRVVAEIEEEAVSLPARVDPREWFAAIRKQAGERKQLAELSKVGDDLLADASLPTRKQEPFRFTDLEALFRTPYVVPAPGSAAAAAALAATYRIDGAAGRQLVFVNGEFSAELSDVSNLGQGVHLTTLGAASEGVLAQASWLLSYVPEVGADPRSSQGSLPFASLSQACFRDAAVLVVAEGAQLEEPMQVLYLSTGGASGAATVSHPRLAIHMGKGSKAKLIQSYAGEGEYFANGLGRIVLGEGSELDHTYVQEQTAASQHIDTLSVDISGNATYHSRAVGMGGHHGRLNIQATLAAEGAHVELDGVNLCNGRQCLDTHTTIVHNAVSATSVQQQRNILADRSECIFKGRIRVEGVAQGTDSAQQCKTLLLTDNARITAMPSLEIIADDVKCSHGATVSDLDEECLFYLQSRGIDKMLSRSLVVNAFVYEQLAGLPCPRLDQRVRAKLREMTPTADRAVKGEFQSI